MKTRDALLESSRQHKLALKKELEAMAVSTTNIAKKLAVIGAMAAGAYLLFQYFNEEEESDDEPSGNQSAKQSTGWRRVGKVLAHQAVLHVLNDSKNRIQEYLAKIEENEKSS